MRCAIRTSVRAGWEADRFGNHGCPRLVRVFMKYTALPGIGRVAPHTGLVTTRWATYESKAILQFMREAADTAWHDAVNLRYG